MTYYGHSCFGVELAGNNLLFDPFITPNELASAIDVDSIPADYILVSHGHEDHVVDVVSIATRTGAQVISNYEIVTWFAKNGINNGHPMNLGGHWLFDFGKLKCVNAVHSSVLPDGSYGGNPMGFLVESDSGSFYYAGDTALTYDMKLIGEYANIDFAMLPIGNNFTMGVENAIIASDFIGCDNIIGMHYDTFGYIRINHYDAIGEFNNSGKTLTLPEIGKRFEIEIKTDS